MNESNLRNCKSCLQLKTRTEDGKYRKSKNKRYIDENGRCWSGNTCPDCHAIRSKDNMKKMRFQRKFDSYVKEEK